MKIVSDSDFTILIFVTLINKLIERKKKEREKE